MNEELTPVIVGVGEITDRPSAPDLGLEPLALMAAALQRADQDSTGVSLLASIDSLDVVNLVSWRYSEPAAQLAALLDIQPRRAVYGPLGGESPVRYIHEAALRIATGESAVAAVVGAEARNSVVKAKRAGVTLPWTPYARESQRPLRGSDILRPQAVELGVDQPTTVYPFYASATAAHWQQTPREALDESGDLWARYSQAAAENPGAWLKRAYSAQEIITPTQTNSLIAWPYTKLMVANPTVNQGAAVLITSLARARAAGIAEERIIHIWGGAKANEPRDYLDRDNFHQCHAQDAVLEAAQAIAGRATFDALELYSCFPCVPKMARRSLGLNADVELTVTGGLTFFGAPLNGYMTHAVCAMVRRLRETQGVGLVYGQGEYLTKHHALVLSARAPVKPILGWAVSVQAAADSRRGAVPPFKADAEGVATLETFTVIYDDAGLPSHGVVILRTNTGDRTIARVPANDIQTLNQLTDLDRSPIGSRGEVRQAMDGILDWRIAS